MKVQSGMIIIILKESAGNRLLIFLKKEESYGTFNVTLLSGGVGDSPLLDDRDFSTHSPGGRSDDGFHSDIDRNFFPK
jgi:hypothetical protein